MTPYREQAVLPELAGRLACVWSVRHDAPARVKPIVPDACIDLIWSSYDGSVHVAGPDSAPFMAALRPGEEFAGVRFRPGAAAEVLGVPAGTIRDRRVWLRELWGRDADRIAEMVATAADRPRALEALVARRAVEAGPRDRTATGVVRRLRAGGPIRTLAADLGYSERQLLRRCNDAFGYGPKTLQRILRFQRALHLIGTGVALTKVAAEAGYADHAHLAREMRQLAGVPPSALAA